MLSWRGIGSAAWFLGTQVNQSGSENSDQRRDRANWTGLLRDVWELQRQSRFSNVQNVAPRESKDVSVNRARTANKDGVLSMELRSFMLSLESLCGRIPDKDMVKQTLQKLLQKQGFTATQVHSALIRDYDRRVKNARPYFLSMLFTDGRRIIEDKLAREELSIWRDACDQVEALSQRLRQIAVRSSGFQLVTLVRTNLLRDLSRSKKEYQEGTDRLARLQGELRQIEIEVEQTASKLNSFFRDLDSGRLSSNENYVNARKQVVQVALQELFFESRVYSASLLKKNDQLKNSLQVLQSELSSQKAKTRHLRFNI